MLMRKQIVVIGIRDGNLRMNGNVKNSLIALPEATSVERNKWVSLATRTISGLSH